LGALTLSLLAPSPDVWAQRTGEAWMAQHLREVATLRQSPRGALPLQRLRGLRDHVDPVPLAESLARVAALPGLLPLLRDQAVHAQAEILRDLGAIPRAEALTAGLGFVTRWSVVGPFDNEGRAGFAREFAPEAARHEALSPEARYDGIQRSVGWRPLPAITRLGYVPLDPVVRPSVNACAYAHTTLTAAQDAPALLWLGATGAVAAWVNGAEVYRDTAVRRASPDRAGVSVRLRRGANRVLVKVCSDDRGLGFFLRLTTPAGAPRTDLRPTDDLAAAPVQPRPAAPTAAPATTPATPVVPRVLGVFASLRTAGEGPTATAQGREDLARWIHLTHADDLTNTRAADLAEQAAQTTPTSDRWLLLADITTDRNRRLEALRRALALAPRDPHVLTAMGHALRTGVRPEDGLALIDQALALDPGYVLAHIERALCLDGVGLPFAAHRALEDDAAALAPRSAQLLRVRIAMAERASQNTLANELRRTLARLRGGDVDVWEALARDARTRGDANTVRTLAERIVALRPDLLSVYNQAAELLESIGDADRAVAVLVQGTEMVPGEAALWTSRAALEARLGRNDAARVSMRQALALRPQDTALRQHLASLEPQQARPDETAAEASEVFLARRSQRPAEGYNVRALQDLTVRTVYPNGLSGTFRQVVYEVANEQGARDGRAYTLRYDPSGERYELRTARVYHPDGSVDEGTQVEEFNVSSDPATRMYFSSRIVRLTFPSLGAGDVVEVRWRTDDASPRNAFADYFGDLQLVQAPVPRAHFAYVLRAPATREFFVHTTALPNGRALVLDDRVEGDTRVRSWSADDVPAVPPEDRAPGLTERGAYLHLSTYRDWADVGRWYWGLVRDQLVLDDRLRLVVREITAGLSTDRERVRAIYHWVITHTRYVALEFGIHGFKPYAVPQVCTRGFGDCKDKASVIVTMLREVGIEASLVLLRTRANGAVAEQPASLALFDHAIAYVPSLNLFLDGTAHHSGMDELPGGDQGVMALLVNGRGEAQLVQTPVYGPERNWQRVTSELSLAADGSATLHTTQEMQGPDAPALRQQLEAEATRVERVEDLLRDRYPGVRVTRVATGNLADLELPARLEFEATVSRIGTRQGADLLLPLAPPLDLARRYASRSNRTHDLIVGIPSTVEESRTVRLPAGATASDLPPAVQLESPFGRFELRVEATGQTLQVRRVLTLSRDRVRPAEYAAFRAFCQGVDEALVRRVTVRMPARSEEPPR